MKSSFYCYLESYEKISIIVNKELYNKDETYTLVGNDEIIDLLIFEHFTIGDQEKIVANFDAYLKLEEPYYVVSKSGEKSYLRMGKIVRTPLFDSIYHYKKDDLGYTYTKESTKFKIWSPTAKSVKLELISKDGVKEVIDAKYRTQGIYRTIVDKDLEGYKYRYIINVNGEDKTTVDPYAISASANGEYGYVVDKEKFYKMKKYLFKNEANTVIYETSIRDFTSLFKDDLERSTYNAFTKEYKTKGSNDAGIKYLKKLGVTHIQIMPMFLYGEVDENDRFGSYNWGYNPVLYNVPSGMYTTKPNDPYARINELKRMIDRIHSYGIKVIMDVVYNHVYDAVNYPFEIMCPGYMYVYNREGIRTENSGCGNDVNTTKSMVRKFIYDSIHYWLDEYSVDGFRFDLMGLIDFETMNDIALDLTDSNPNILIYGEGWKMFGSNMDDNLAHMFNKNVVSEIGFFNDRFRNEIKNYCASKNYDIKTVTNCILGSCVDKFLFKYAHQSINYIECHDDKTVYDFLKYDNNFSNEEIKARCLLGISMVLLSFGLPFIHSGMEFFRTKNNDKNSYNLPDSINAINWNEIDNNKETINYVKELIKIRRSHDCFKYDNPTVISKRSNIKVTSLDTIIFEINSEKYDLIIVFKNNEQSEFFNYKDYRTIFTSMVVSSNDTVSGIGTLILKKGESMLELNKKYTFYALSEGIFESNSDTYPVIMRINKNKNITVRVKNDIKIENNKFYYIEGVGIEYKNRIHLRLDSFKLLEELNLSIKEMESIKCEILGNKMIKYTEFASFIENEIDNIENQILKDITKEIYYKYKEDFIVYPAASKFHHAYRHGLIYHTYDCLKLGLAYCDLYEAINKDLVVSGIVLHDMMKVKELKKDSQEYTVEGKLIGHISLMSNEIEKVASNKGYDGSEEVLLLNHIILSHHDEGEFGSPKNPQILEALIVHLVDLSDARIVPTIEALEKTNTGEFSEQIFVNDRHKYLKHKLSK